MRDDADELVFKTFGCTDGRAKLFPSCQAKDYDYNYSEYVESVILERVNHEDSIALYGFLFVSKLLSFLMRNVAHGLHKIFVKVMHAVVHKVTMTVITKKILG